MNKLKDICININYDPCIVYLQYKEYIYKLRKLVSPREVKGEVAIRYPKPRVQRKLRLTKGILTKDSH